MAKPNEITPLLFTHILLRGKKKILPRLICTCPSNLRLCRILSLLPVRILCFNRCLFTEGKTTTNKPKCLSDQIWKYQKNNLVHSLTAFTSLQAICAITARDGKLIICSGFVWLWFTMCKAVNQQSKKVGAVEEASESGEEMGQEKVGTESNFSYLSRNVVESNINDATALNKHSAQGCAACI